MNRNTIYAAIPFAVIADTALVVKGFWGYSDPTLTALAIGCTVITVLLIMKAVGWLRMPTFSSRSHQEPQVVHHHHYHGKDEDEDDCDNDCECDEDAAYERGYEAGSNSECECDGDESESYDDGYEAGRRSVLLHNEKIVEANDNGYRQGHTDGYNDRKAEEETEAQEMAKVIIDALRKGKVEVEVPDVDPTSEVPPTQPHADAEPTEAPVAEAPPADQTNNPA